MTSRPLGRGGAALPLAVDEGRRREGAADGGPAGSPPPGRRCAPPVPTLARPPAGGRAEPQCPGSAPLTRELGARREPSGRGKDDVAELGPRLGRPLLPAPPWTRPEGPSTRA